MLKKLSVLLLFFGFLNFSASASDDRKSGADDKGGAKDTVVIDISKVALFRPVSVSTSEGLFCGIALLMSARATKFNVILWDRRVVRNCTEKNIEHRPLNVLDNFLLGIEPSGVSYDSCGNYYGDGIY